MKLSEIDPIYFDKTYYIGADTGGIKPYALLSEILKKSKKIGISKRTIRSKEYLAAIRPHNNLLVLETLHFPDEVREAKYVPNGIVEQLTVSEKEFEVGMLLVDQLTTKFEPTKYTDTYRTALEQLITEKMEKNEYLQTQEADTKQADNIVDLMAALQASIDKIKQTPEKPAKPKRIKKKTS